MNDRLLKFSSPIVLLVAAGCSSAPMRPGDPNCLRQLKTMAEQRRSTEKRHKPESAARETGLTESQVKAAVEKIRPRLKACFEKSGSDGGKIETQFLVNANGTVAQACIQESNLETGELEACTLGLLRTVQFPPTLGDVAVTVSFPFHFNVK